MRIGFQLSGLKSVLKSEREVRDALYRLAGIGYEALQIQWIDPAVPDEAVRDALLEAKLACVATQDYFEVVEANLERVISQSRLWGSRMVTVSGVPEGMFSPEGLRAFLTRLRLVYARLSDEGLTLAFHPRAREFASVTGTCAAQIVMDALPYDAQIALDLYHVRKAGLDAAETIRRFAGRMDIVHLKDSRALPGGGEELVPLGRGETAWRPAFAACEKACVRWGMVEQETWSGDPFEAPRLSREYALSLGAK